MATKSTKKSSVIGERVLAADINPKDPDLKYTGPEPLFVTQPDPDRRQLALVQSFNWYGRYYQYKEAKQFLVQYAVATGQTERVKELQRAEDREVLCTLGWLARMWSRGLDLTDSEQQALAREISRVADTVAKPENVTKTVETVVSAPRPTIQDIMRERARDAAGEMEGWLDDFVLAGARTVQVDPVSALTQRNIMPQHVSILTEVWRKHLDEYQEVLAGKDPQLTEAYSHYTKTQIKSLIKFCEAVIAGLGSYVSIKKAATSVRKRKPQSPERVASKVKYLKTFEDTATKIKLTSVSPAKLIGASEAYLYDTVKRKVVHVVADSHIGSLGIKGTTILGYDETKSQIKTVRKPERLLKDLMAAGKPASRKVFAELTTVGTRFNGRTNENMIILKVS